MKDAINHPPHYNDHPAGIECIDVVEHFGFSVGNAIKYLWRAGLKGDRVEDLKKARWYIDREIEKAAKDAAAQQKTAAAIHRSEGARQAAVTRKRNAARAARALARKRERAKEQRRAARKRGGR